MRIFFKHLFNKNFYLAIIIIWFFVFLLFYIVIEKQQNIYSKIGYIDLGGFGKKYIEHPFDMKLRFINKMKKENDTNNDSYLYEFNQVGKSEEIKYLYKFEIRGTNPDKINQTFINLRNETMNLHKMNELRRLENIKDFEISIKNYLINDIKLLEYLEINYPENNLSWEEFIYFFTQHIKENNYKIDDNFFNDLEKYLKNKKNLLSPEYIPSNEIFMNLLNRYQSNFRQTSFQERELTKIDIPASLLIFSIMNLLLLSIFMITIFFEYKKNYEKF